MVGPSLVLNCREERPPIAVVISERQQLEEEGSGSPCALSGREKVAA